jgi:hypothetical protein
VLSISPDCHQFCAWISIKEEIKNDCGFARDNVKLYFDKAEGGKGARLLKLEK